MRKSLKSALAFIAVLLVLPLGAATPVHAASQTIPSSLRGTWYHYYSGWKRVDKLKVTKYSVKHSLSKIKKDNNQTGQLVVTKQANHGYEIKKPGTIDGISYQRMTRKINNKKHKVLLVAPSGGMFIYTRFNPGHHEYLFR